MELLQEVQKELENRIEISSMPIAKKDGTPLKMNLKSKIALMAKQVGLVVLKDTVKSINLANIKNR
jgi:high-affinity K+ transport system ATPase subunit B